MTAVFEELEDVTCRAAESPGSTCASRTMRAVPLRRMLVPPLRPPPAPQLHSAIEPDPGMVHVPLEVKAWKLVGAPPLPSSGNCGIT